MPAPALAGAWIAPEDGQEIWTSVAGLRDEEVGFFETSAYYEIPIAERVAVVAAPFFEQAYDVGDEGWRAEATLALKTAILRDDRTAVAIQGGVVWNSWPNFGCAETGAELRFLAGRSFGETGFINAEIAQRAFEGDCGGQRLDLTAGFRPNDSWLAMGQVFMDAPRDGQSSVKAQISLVRFGAEGRGVQLGLRARIDDGLAEPALVLGFWGRPGS
jgi:hypothetical protein